MHDECWRAVQECKDELPETVLAMLLPKEAYKKHGLCFCGCMVEVGVLDVGRWVQAIRNHHLVVEFLEQNNLHLSSMKGRRYYDILNKAERISGADASTGGCDD